MSITLFRQGHSCPWNVHICFDIFLNIEKLRKPFLAHRPYENMEQGRSSPVTLVFQPLLKVVHISLVGCGLGGPDKPTEVTHSFGDIAFSKM